MSDDYSKDLFEFFQKMWNPASFPIPGMFTPTMDVGEVEKKIAELQSVENWLKMNLSFLQMTIKTLEMQKSALQTLQESDKARLRPGQAMRINETARLPVTRPESKGPVARVTAATPVGSQSPMPSEPGHTLPERIEPRTPLEERRVYVRRSDERRKSQVQVLMDTRVAQRRMARRRAVDEAPTSIDVQA